MMIDLAQLEAMTPDERLQYEHLLRLDVAKQSPLDLACLVYPETRRWDQLELLNEHLVALVEYRLTKDGPIKASNVQWWYVREGDTEGVQVLVGDPSQMPEEVDGYGAFDIMSGAEIVFQLSVSMMPRAGKSRLITEIFPLWLLLHDPDLQIGLGTYSDTFAGDWGEAMKKNVIAHHENYKEEGRKPFLPYPQGGLRAARDIFQVDGAKGKIRYTGTGGGVTGKTLHVLIGDDFVKNEEDVLSEATRHSIHRFLTSTWRTRKTRNLQANSWLPIPVEVLMATRWHRMDPIGFSCFDPETGAPLEDWCILNIPALATEGPEGDPLGREEGQAHPNAAGHTRLTLEKKRGDEPREFSALYQGNPVVEGGNLVSSDFRTYSVQGERNGGGSADERHLVWRQLTAGADEGSVPEIHSVPLRECVVFAVADMAATKKSAADYTVMGIFAYSREYEVGFVIDWYRKRITTDQYLEELVPMIEDNDCVMTVVENVTYGQMFGQGLEREKMPVELAEVMADKVARVLTSKVSSKIRGGALRVPASAPWIANLKSETGLFPNDEHDDQVDVLAFYGLYVNDLPEWRAPREERALSRIEEIEAHAEREHAKVRGGKRYRRRGGWSRI